MELSAQELADVPKLEDSPLLRHIDPSEPFDRHTYAFNIGQAYRRYQQSIREKGLVSAAYATKVLTAYYTGNPIPPKSKLVLSTRLKGAPKVILALLRKHGPMTAIEIRDTLNFKNVGWALHLLRRQKKVKQEGIKSTRSATWHALT